MVELEGFPGLKVEYIKPQVVRFVGTSVEQLVTAVDQDELSRFLASVLAGGGWL